VEKGSRTNTPDSLLNRLRAGGDIPAALREATGTGGVTVDGKDIPEALEECYTGAGGGSVEGAREVPSYVSFILQGSAGVCVRVWGWGGVCVSVCV
jgi:hypothetical protein